MPGEEEEEEEVESEVVGKKGAGHKITEKEEDGEEETVSFLKKASLVASARVLAFPQGRRERSGL